MKINECTLAAFATSHTDAPDKEGWLWKKGEVNKAFQRRYFVLKGNLLFYFERRTDRDPIGVIILEGCTIELAEEDQERFSFKINFHTGGGDQHKGSRIYHLGTECQDTMEEWMKLLACASHDYMKLMVYELQEKLAELDSMESTANFTCDVTTDGLSSQVESTMPVMNDNNMLTRKFMPNSTSQPDNLTNRSNTFPKEGLHNSRCASAVTLVSKSKTGTRKNPFDDMPPFDPLSEKKGSKKPTSNFHEDHVSVNDSMLSQETYVVNAWIVLHNAYGKKVLEDRKKWNLQR